MNLASSQSFLSNVNLQETFIKNKPWLKFHIITVFPEMINSYVSESIIKRAKQQHAVQINIYNLRDYATDKHRKVDDRPYGGGPGMVLKIEPIYRVLQMIRKKVANDKLMQVILTDATGIIWNQSLAKEWLQWEVNKTIAEESFKFNKKGIGEIISINPKFTEIVIICGRYQGVDIRIEKFIDEKITLGSFILTGGELPALVIIDTLTRLLPGVLGAATSPVFETSFTSYKAIKNQVKGQKSHDLYTRPAKFMAIVQGKKVILSVPDYLLSGDHQRIYDERFCS